MTQELTTVIKFLDDIGIVVVEKTLDAATFLSGIELGPGCLYVDYSKLSFPGDLLHEAGHLAVTAPEIRCTLGTANAPANWPDPGEELAAMLWSYAALTHLGLSPDFVFHAGGYKGDGAWLISEFTSGNHIGLPYLEWLGLCYGPITANTLQQKPFPAMRQWLRDKSAISAVIDAASPATTLRAATTPPHR